MAKQFISKRYLKHHHHYARTKIFSIHQQNACKRSDKKQLIKRISVQKKDSAGHIVQIRLHNRNSSIRASPVLQAKLLNDIAVKRYTIIFRASSA
ncbi:hypothetical protein [Citrobacter meridianamericanus]|uniref:Uncharacterized protein n=1 Tax=Citrobacter meridianamericanus TaxID=2894201 RepID=A0ABT1BFP6_9ENTR|nr:hypothetical protein [Citrobacter meridianamericanus]MCO5784361.1 hypothetical protein [Citrobacter meridianamericanus]